MPQSYTAKAINFGKQLGKDFSRLYSSATKRPDEIGKFNALISCFDTNAQSLIASSYHGNVSQVEFPHNPPWTRTKPTSPRCELADVLFVAFTPIELRITFLQAKSVVYSSPLPVRLANAEQYALLSLRPVVTNWVGSIGWNNDVLNNALLPSVGSFGIFYGDIGGAVYFHYLSAALLSPVSIPRYGRYVTGTFDLIHPTQLRRYSVGKIAERIICNDLADFGAALFSLEIGTPIQLNIDAISNKSSNGRSSSENSRIALAKWLKNAVVEMTKDKEKHEDKVKLLNDFLNSSHFEGLPDVPLSEVSEIGAKFVVLVKGESKG